MACVVAVNPVVVITMIVFVSTTLYLKDFKIYLKKRKVIQMSRNPNTMLKAEIIDRFNYCCKHGKNGWEHPACYEKDRVVPEKIGCIDIETSNLHADFGIILSWCIKTVGEDVIYYDALTTDDVKTNVFDKRIVETLVATMRQYDRLVGQFSTYFDLPFIRTRALHWDLDFPKYKEICHTDVWAIAKKKLRLHSNRQGSISETILHEDIKTRIHPDVWVKIQFGSDKARRSAIAYILDHNEKDVLQLEGNYLKLRPYVHETKRSI
jgi:hypothetical protein